MATGFYIQGLGIVGSLVFVVGGAVVIDGNGDGIWWQVLAVAFCIGQQLVVGVGAAVRKLTMLRLCDTPPLGLLTPVSRRLLPDDTKQQTGMRPPPNMMQYTRSGSSLVEQSMRDMHRHWLPGKQRVCQLGSYNLAPAAVSFIRSQPTTSQLSLLLLLPAP